MLHLNDDDLRPINDLIVHIFRVGGSLLEGGAALVENIGLTPARWQVLGALGVAHTPLTVPQIARHMGLTRQSVQRIIDLLVAEGLVRLESNPNHLRAKLTALTDDGERLYREAQKRQLPWSESLEEGMSPESILTAVEVLKFLDRRLAEQALTRAGEPVVP